MQSVWNALDNFWWSVTHLLSLTDVLDILIVAALLYQLVILTKQTPAVQVLKGLAVLLVFRYVSELIHLYTLQLSPTQEIVNIGTGTFLKYDLNLSVLREALNRAVERCEAMRLRLWKDPETNELWQYVEPYQNRHFEYYDFSALTEEKAQSILERWTSQPFDTFGGELNRIVIVSMPDGSATSTTAAQTQALWLRLQRTSWISTAT